MNTQIQLLRTLVMKDLDPSYFNLNEQEVSYWVNEIPLIGERIFKVMQDEMLGEMDNSLVERHLKQVQYDCVYLLNALSKYQPRPELPAMLYELAGDCLDRVMTEIEDRYAGFFNLQKATWVKPVPVEPHPRIGVLFSVDTLAYFFKLLNKAGGLDGSPVAHLIIAVSKNFITPGIGNGYISPNSLTTKYKQVVQSTAQNVRVLLVRMLKHLDQEFG
jgi:hypothetical protein